MKITLLACSLYQLSPQYIFLLPIMVRMLHLLIAVFQNMHMISIYQEYLVSLVPTDETSTKHSMQLFYLPLDFGPKTSRIVCFAKIAQSNKEMLGQQYKDAI